jgi:large subunit ribosomal protein L3
MAGILGKKLGMTQVFNKEGRCVPITVIQAGPCTVIQKKTMEIDGYTAVQLGFEEIEFRKLGRAMKGHFQKKNQKAFRWLKEFRTPQLESYNVGQILTAKQFKTGDFINVTGVSKGKGFQGVIKRHHKAGGPKSHGSCFHRSTGSIGQRTFPGKVFKNMKLPGHLGDRQVTVKNLEVVEIRPEENLIFIKGAVPGGPNAFLVINNLAQDFEQRKEEAIAS